MSRTIGSPARDHPVGRLVVRRGRVRARTPTIAKSASSWPSAISRSRTSRATSASVRPTSRPGGDLGDDPVGGVGGLGQQRDLVGVLDHPQAAEDRRRELEPGTGEPRLERGAGGAPRGRPRPRSAGRPGPPAAPRTIDARTSAIRVRPPRPRARPASVAARPPAGTIGGRGLEARHDQEPLAGRRDDEHRQALERHRG